jgi:hypothetical protein
MNSRVFYRRNLPHWHPDGAAVFLTWRLHGCLPLSADTANLGCDNRVRPGLRFKVLDAALDKASIGPRWLEDPRIAACVVNGIRTGEASLGFYKLHAFVVMPNHVHLLISPRLPLPRIMNGLKGVTARDSNRILGHRGISFWQDESFDHWVRSAEEFDRIRAYIEFNPVSAGLVTRSEDWPWSSASALVE